MQWFDDTVQYLVGAIASSIPAMGCIGAGTLGFEVKSTDRGMGEWDARGEEGENVVWLVSRRVVFR